MGVGTIATPICLHVKILVVTSSSRSNTEILDVREGLAHSHVPFLSYMCGLNRGVAAVAVALIYYDDLGLLL
jgi:hypothetical protein